MGDRCIMHVTNGKEIGPGVYLHWAGGEDGVFSLVSDLRKRMADRTGDVSYASARLIGLAHESISGALSLGAWSLTASTYHTALREISADSYSHGDVGVVLIDCNNWDVFAHGGYAVHDKRFKAWPKVKSDA